MLSLYIHTPFCDQKCKYCSFQVIPCDNIEHEEKMIDVYVKKLKEEIVGWGNSLPTKEIKSLYFGGGTPNKIWKNRLMDIIDCVEENFDLENLWELSIELNPYPEDETLDLIKTIQKKYKKFPRIRWSIGLQTFDIDILKESRRAYSFPAIVDFLRGLRELKEMNTVFNFDFIAFGKFNKSKKWNSFLRDEHKQKFFHELVNSQFADWFSLYTLELFSGSEWANTVDQKEWIYCEKYGTEDDVYDEFAWLKDVVLDAWYNRYELSNFASTGRDSIHNRVYRNMENYIWIWTSASSFINFSKGQFSQKWQIELFEKKLWIKISEKSKWIRRTNTFLIWNYLNNKFLDEQKTIILDAKNFLSEEFFLTLRTNDEVKNINMFEKILESDYIKKIEEFVEQWLCNFKNNKLKLTDKGMDLYNGIITELMAEV